MAFTLNPGQGSLFANDKGGVQSRPDYRGNININGTIYQIAGWWKPKQDGSYYLSLNAEIPQQQAAPQGAAPAQPGYPQGPQPQYQAPQQPYAPQVAPYTPAAPQTPQQRPMAAPQTVAGNPWHPQAPAAPSPSMPGDMPMFDQYGNVIG